MALVSLSKEGVLCYNVHTSLHTAWLALRIDRWPMSIVKNIPKPLSISLQTSLLCPCLLKASKLSCIVDSKWKYNAGKKTENQSNLRDSLNRLDSPFRVYLLRGAWLGGCLHVWFTYFLSRERISLLTTQIICTVGLNGIVLLSSFL